MAATGKTPILLYGSTTPTNAPAAGNLTNSSDGCEIAINVADKNLFFKDSTNAVNTVPIRQSSASSNGWLSSTDWSTFNSKQPAGTYVTSVTGTAPVVSSGGTTPAISMAAADGSTNGYLTSTDWSTFNSKAPAFTYTTNYIPFGQGTTTPTQSSLFTYTSGNLLLGTSTNSARLSIGVNSANADGIYALNANNSGYFSLYACGATGYGVTDWANSTLLEAVPASGGNLVLGSYSGSVVIQTGARAQSSRFFASGGVSIGNTTDPGAGCLNVNSKTFIGGINSGGGNLNVSGNIYVYSMSSGAGTNALKYNTGTGAFTYDTSSRYFKEEIQDLKYGLAEVLQMKPRSYTWKTGGAKDVGFIADEMINIVPEIVPIADNSVNDVGVPDGEPLSVNYDRITAILVKAVQELHAEVQSLKSQLENSNVAN